LVGPRYPIFNANKTDDSGRRCILQALGWLAQATVDNNLAINIRSEHIKHFKMKKAFHIDVHHSVVYFAGNLEKIGSSGDGKERSRYYDMDYDDEALTDSIIAILDIDTFNCQEDQKFRELVKQTINEHNLTFAPRAIPKTLQECEGIMKENGVNFVLQFLFHSIVHTTEESPQLGGAEKVRGFTKTLVTRMVESGHQENLGNGLNDRTSAHEFLNFDFTALKRCNESAIQMAKSMADKLVVLLKERGCDNPTEKLRDVANNNFRTYMGSWRPGGLNCWTEATPFIALFMMMLGKQFSSHGQRHRQDQERWFSDAIQEPTPANNKDCYNTDFYTDKHKEQAVKNICDRLTEIEKQGGWHAIDTNEMSFQHAECKSLKELVTRRDNWKLIENTSDSKQESLTLFLYYNEANNVIAILGVMKPLCYMIMSEAGFPIDKNSDQMTHRAICAESFRLLLAYFLNGASEYPSQDELFNGNIVIFHSVYMYFTLGLKGSPKAGSLLAKQFLAPLEFNLMESEYHNMSLKDDTGALSTRARRENKHLASPSDPEEEQSGKRTADAWIFRKCIFKILKHETGQSASLESKLEGVVAILRDGVTPNTFNKRWNTFLNHHIRSDEARKVFKDIIDEKKANTGNCKRKYQGPTTSEDVEKGDQWIDEIVKQVKANGEFVFWIKGYTTKDIEKAKARGKQSTRFFEIGSDVVWGGKMVNFHIGDDAKRQVPFREVFPESTIVYETLRTRLLLGTCHEFAGPFNMNEDGQGWVLAKVVTAKPKPDPAAFWDKVVREVTSNGEYVFWIIQRRIRRRRRFEI